MLQRAHQVQACSVRSYNIFKSYLFHQQNSPSICTVSSDPTLSDQCYNVTNSYPPSYKRCCRHRCCHRKRKRNHDVSQRYASCCHWSQIDQHDDSERRCRQSRVKWRGTKGRECKHPKSAWAFQPAQPPCCGMKGQERKQPKRARAFQPAQTPCRA